MVFVSLDEVLMVLARLSNPHDSWDEPTLSRAEAAIRALPSQTVQAGWRDITTAPKERIHGVFQEVLLIGHYPGARDWSDVVHSWWSCDKWARWEHSFPPTHWLPLSILPIATPKEGSKT